ncbi:phytanoyl-CoA dioxygenase (PhyH) family domain protein [Burkholderia pseudomallei MSHR435]|nr:phytanoyl-CoA dioxygenase (PhyH) family domain protein [Burkholderia pseudomallei MSHR435]
MRRARRVETAEVSGGCAPDSSFALHQIRGDDRAPFFTSRHGGEHVAHVRFTIVHR